MNTSEVSKILRKTADILDLFGDIPLQEALDDIYRTIDRKKSNTKKEIRAKEEEANNSILITDELILQMSEMKNDELSNFLKNHKIFNSKSGLLSLAEKLSLQLSARNNIETLAHSILKHFERLRLDTMIQNERNN
ncbi:hypothetical protein F9B85_13500 [Heliorestis acidaminivorans]|uniref:Uncharacterized protein n=1 Tax=Heliorestis acidaminivorans TaxID=553427 RepID=A0A6I0EX80_9FIRM|nr:hypothetical protein [Heliorestis acidaminivorans]KAB2951075.1 hypothetical protein F9B85_13500 [Heliorestis acidaminivorans]